MRRRTREGMALAGVMAALALAGCDARDGDGRVQIDGSSTVYPITEAVAEDFMAETGGRVHVTVGVSGTGGGFKRFCAGETDISNASRPIKAEEREACERVGVEYEELPIAYDGIAVVVHPDNGWAVCMTPEELGRMWRSGSTVRQWSDVRPEWPAQPIRLYGPGTDSGTFDYFTEAVTGTERNSRPDYMASEDDNVLVQGVAGDLNALGYFGVAYFVENRGRLKAVAIDGGEGCIGPEPAAIAEQRYRPLSRPVFIYVNRASLERPAVSEFVRYYMDTAATLAEEVGYVRLPADRYRANIERLERLAGGA
jgi:phosphate transport system substrate-binding protein